MYDYPTVLLMYFITGKTFDLDLMFEYINLLALNQLTRGVCKGPHIDF